MRKITKYGFVKIVRFLTNTKEHYGQFCVEKPDCVVLFYGVPQETVLEPLVFILYVSC